MLFRSPLPPGITVAFNQRDDAHYRSPINGALRRGDNLEELLLQSIHSAKREVLVAVQELSLPAVAQALAEQHRRGRRVRVVLENTYSTPWSEQHEAELSPHLRGRRRQLLQLADRNHDGVLSPAEREAGVARRLIGLATEGRQPPREGADVVVDDAVVGTVTSGNFSPMLGHGIALALVDAGAGIEVGDGAALVQRGRALPATVVATPFTRPGQWAHGA